MDKAKKQWIRKVITWGAIALVVALLAAMPLLARQEAEADGPVASILSGEVTKGTLSSTLHGGGNLEAENVEEVKIPSGVKIEGFLVKNGQFVTEGTPLAQVDKVSVMTAILEVDETLEFLREELEDARTEKVASSIQATAGGRVKKIFAQPGESIQEVMLRDGALAILSLDGLMAVKLERSLEISTGESVTVVLSNGEEITGRVESNLDNTVIITVEDKGYQPGQTVIVLNEEGKRLGQSTLYIHNAWKVTGYTGTIETVSTKEEKTLSSGAVLFTVTDRDYEGELRRRANQHREYEELLQELFRMYQSGYLYAPCDGEVEGVDSDSVHLLNATPEGWVIAPLNSTTTEAEEPGWTVMLLHHSTPQGCANNDDCCLDGDSEEHLETCPMRCMEDIQCKAKKHKPGCIRRCDSDNRSCPAQVHYDGCISVCTGKSGCQALPNKHKDNCPEKCTGNALCKSTRPVEEHTKTCVIHCIKDTNGVDGCQCTGEHAHYNVCVGMCTGGMDCAAINHKGDCDLYGVTYKATVGIVVRSASNTIEYKYDRCAVSMNITRAADGSWVLPYTPTAETMNNTAFVNSEGKFGAGTIILIITATKGDNVIFQNQVYAYSTGTTPGDAAGTMPGGMNGAGGMGGMSGMGGMGGMGGFGGMAGFGNSAAGTEEDEGLFDLEGSTLLTVTAHDSARLVISIDEHDIARVQPGMKATVKAEALKGQTFEAEVTSIAVSGTNNGGSSKFEVTLTLPMSEDMLSGMSASAVIRLEEKQDILLIPAAALIQQGAKTLVYTALDKEGQPAEPVEVKTGLTDGESVEILSGLTEGQKFYYRYYDTVELDNSVEKKAGSLFG